MVKSRTQLWSLMASILFCFTLAQTSLAAGDYYRWVGEDGVVHYGSRPPQGVQAERISTYGKAQPDTPSGGDSAGVDASQGADSANPEDVLAMREQQCTDERQRLQSLRKPGTRIRMEQPDGTIRYLTPEEVAREINSSEEFLSQACK